MARHISQLAKSTIEFSKIRLTVARDAACALGGSDWSCGATPILMFCRFSTNGLKLADQRAKFERFRIKPVKLHFGKDTMFEKRSGAQSGAQSGARSGMLK